MKNIKKFLPVLMAVSVLFGCSDPDAEVKQAMNEIRAKQGTKIKPIPSFYQKRTVTYDMSAERNPFWSYPLYIKMRDYVPKKIKVDLTRPLQPLEHFSLDSLLFSGVLSKGGKLDAMIQTPDGDVAVARVGDYIGQNHGLIKTIDKEAVMVVEAVKDSSGDFIERPRTMYPVQPKTPDRTAP